MSRFIFRVFFFFFNDTATTEIYTLSLHDALPICCHAWGPSSCHPCGSGPCCHACRSEEHTSELQSPYDLVCSLLLEKKKNKQVQRKCDSNLDVKEGTSIAVRQQ